MVATLCGIIWKLVRGMREFRLAQRCIWDDIRSFGMCTQRRFVVSERRFGTTIRFHLHKSRRLILVVGPDRLSRNVANYTSTLHNIPEERGSQLLVLPFCSIYLPLSMCVCIYIYIYIHIHIHTHTHTYTYVCVCVCV